MILVTEEAYAGLHHSLFHLNLFQETVTSESNCFVSAGNTWSKHSRCRNCLFWLRPDIFPNCPWILKNTQLVDVRPSKSCSREHNHWCHSNLISSQYSSQNALKLGWKLCFENIWYTFEKLCLLWHRYETFSKSPWLHLDHFLYMRLDTYPDHIYIS